MSSLKIDKGVIADITCNYSCSDATIKILNFSFNLPEAQKSLKKSDYIAKIEAIGFKKNSPALRTHLKIAQVFSDFKDKTEIFKNILPSFYSYFPGPRMELVPVFPCVSIILSTHSGNFGMIVFFRPLCAAVEMKHVKRSTQNLVLTPPLTLLLIPPHLRPLHLTIPHLRPLHLTIPHLRPLHLLIPHL